MGSGPWSIYKGELVSLRLELSPKTIGPVKTAAPRQTRAQDPSRHRWVHCALLFHPGSTPVSIDEGHLGKNLQTRLTDLVAAGLQSMLSVFYRASSHSFIRQYAYHGEDSSRLRTQFTHEQPPALRQRSLDTNQPGIMAPPPPSNQGKRFKPATNQAYRETDQRMEVSTPHMPIGPQRITKTFENMGPPPTPKRPFSAALQTPSRVPMIQNTSTLLTNRFMPTSSSHGRLMPGPVAAPAVAPGGNVGRASSGNRMPFTPQIQSSNGLR